MSCYYRERCPWQETRPVAGKLGWMPPYFPLAVEQYYMGTPVHGTIRMYGLDNFYGSIGERAERNRLMQIAAPQFNANIAAYPQYDGENGTIDIRDVDPTLFRRRELLANIEYD